jgi:hypothetical protein
VREQSSFTGRGAHDWAGGYQEFYFPVTPFPFPSGAGCRNSATEKWGLPGTTMSRFLSATVVSSRWISRSGWRAIVFSSETAHP